jgi:hypothetical protein
LKPFSHRTELRIAVIAALALFIAQLGAMAHAYSHQPGAGPVAIHAPNATLHEACDECLNFAPLLAATGVPTLPPMHLTHAVASVVDPVTPLLLGHRTFLAFRSRAPPVER